MTIETRLQRDLNYFAKEVAEHVRQELARACQSCLTCNHFVETTEKCMLNQLRPPAKIIAFGCECYEEEIPF